jgi:hypothetical protein
MKWRHKRDACGAGYRRAQQTTENIATHRRYFDIFMNARNEVERLSGGAQRPGKKPRLKGVFYLR